MSCYLCGKPESAIRVNTLLAFRLYLCHEHDAPECRDGQLKALRASQYKHRVKAFTQASVDPSGRADPDYFNWSLFHKLFVSVECKRDT